MVKKISLVVALAAALAALLWAVRAPGAFADASGAWQAYRTGKYAPAVKELAALAETGDANAQFYLGTLYSDGLAVKRDYRKAIEWYGKAAAKGHGDAEFVLGFLHLSGAGEGASAVPADRNEAVRWLGLAASKGNVAAQSLLAQLQGEGRGVATNEGAATRWALAAAERGDAAAQYELGVLRARSMTADSWADAYMWFRLAERQNYPGARESRMAAAKQLDPKTIAEAERHADMFIPSK